MNKKPSLLDSLIGLKPEVMRKDKRKASCEIKGAKELLVAKLELGFTLITNHLQCKSGVWTQSFPC